MKRLILVRHAKSSWQHPDLDDFDRPLNSRGKTNAPDMGKRLAKLKLNTELLISSPAVRAVKTAKMIADEIAYPRNRLKLDKRIYEAAILDLLDVVQNIEDDYRIVMLVGHNPGITYLGVFLSNYEVENIPTCGVFCIDFKVDSWHQIEKSSGKFVFFDFPKNSKPVIL
jgi:phosphohistidine phosphatase